MTHFKNKKLAVAYLFLSVGGLAAAQNSQAQTDIKQTAGMAGTLGMTVLAVSGHDIVRSNANCAKNIQTLAAMNSACDGPQAATACSPATATYNQQILKDSSDGKTSGACLMAGLNDAAMFAALVPIFSSGAAGDAATGVGAGGASIQSFDPDKPIADQINCPEATCKCSAPDAGSNPVCSTEALKNIAKQLAATKGALADGSLKPGEGQTVEEAMASLDAGAAAAASLAAGVLPPSGGVTASDFSGDPATNGARGAGKGFSVIEGNGTGGGSDYGATKTTAGPADRSGLGATLWNGKLDMVDDATGRSLTLWQRATRRHQGEQGKRAFMLARTEGLRRNQFLKIPKPLAKPVMAQATGTAAHTAPKLAPATAGMRKPASIGKAP